MESCCENVKAVRRSKEEKKLLRKQIKASHTLLKHEGISTVSQPTKSLVVANGGLGNGVSREQLQDVLGEVGEVEILLMPPHKPYALVTYRSEVSAQRGHALNGRQLQRGDQIVTLYLSYVNTVDSELWGCVDLPPGLVLVEEFVSPEEEALLLDAIDWTSHDEDVTVQKVLKHRRVKHFGYEFHYDNNNVDKDKPLPGGLPQVCVPVLERCVRDRHTEVMPDQLTVNQYQSGQGIPPHVDTHSAFEDLILSLSLGAKTVMDFRHPEGRSVAVVLPRRSLLVMKGESRYLWTHGITPRKFDVVPACDPKSPAAVTSDLSNHSNLTLSRRGTRTSLTFRKVRRTPCDCGYPSACDSQQPPAPPSPPFLPRSQTDACRLEAEFVHRVYEEIACHFSSTRHSPWPRVCHFLSSLEPGSILADVGCGNGKYLGVNPDVIAVGCDRSSALVQICSERGFQAFVSDALNVPLRSDTCDACISIAVIHHLSTQVIHHLSTQVIHHLSTQVIHHLSTQVIHHLSTQVTHHLSTQVTHHLSTQVIHHLSTQKRRQAVVEELVRLLRPGGRALIYVWAVEQEYNKQKSKYLKETRQQGPTGDSTDHNNQESKSLTGNTIDTHNTAQDFSGNTTDAHNTAQDLSGNTTDAHNTAQDFSGNTTDAHNTAQDFSGNTTDAHNTAQDFSGNTTDAHNTAQDFSGNTTDAHNTAQDLSGIATDCTKVHRETESPAKLSIHTNRTAFNSQDLLVPWHLKGGVRGGCNQGRGGDEAQAPAPSPVFHRYYHVFQKGELEELCVRVRGVAIQRSYHDQGNWCVILKKTGDR
ncbi:alkylated DNA repair protein alkB homolog 8 isoform X7 [Oncorhynchus keta]|uniref:alkylated DNA repair protein alkB homolog 8 isoform X7 n=1 Tax=Oncorhynchus keta TaxID=8018 RepID=UPI00227CAEA3|nr:alkylated DNA repair protein alkB homolog 8 isoform X7 [Oncorhynchus keta]